MKYTAKIKQNLEGIRTLTHDPLVKYNVNSKNADKRK